MNVGQVFLLIPMYYIVGIESEQDRFFHVFVVWTRCSSGCMKNVLHAPRTASCPDVPTRTIGRSILRLTRTGMSTTIGRSLDERFSSISIKRLRILSSSRGPELPVCGLPSPHTTARKYFRDSSVQPCFSSRQYHHTFFEKTFISSTCWPVLSRPLFRLPAPPARPH